MADINKKAKIIRAMEGIMLKLLQIYEVPILLHSWPRAKVVKLIESDVRVPILECARWIQGVKPIFSDCCDTAQVEVPFQQMIVMT